MADNVSDFMVRRLRSWGVRRIFGYPGDGINGLMGALQSAQRRGEEIDLVQVRHEEMAAFMACGHAKFNGGVGVCLATSGPGAIHLLNGLYDAKLDHQPVLAIVGQSARSVLGGSFQQEVDLQNLFKDVSGYVETAVSPVQIRHLVDRAMRIALAERTVSTLIIPKDVQELDAVTEPPKKHDSVHSGLGYLAPRVVPEERDLDRAADVLNAGKKVAMLVGAGALQASAEVVKVADFLGAGIAKALLGKSVLPDDLPFVTGAIGLLGTRPSWDLMAECDTLLMVGTGFPYPEFLPDEGQARAVQIDLDAKMLSLRYPVEVGLVGDSRETLSALLPRLKYKSDRGWRQKIERRVGEWWRTLESRAMKDANPLNPQRVFWELSRRLPDRCILTSDSGTSANWFARDVRVRTGMMSSLSGNLATMGPGVPYAIAAKLAHPDRPVIALVGDGAMQMNGNGEMVTVAKYWERWQNKQLIVLVLNNRDLNQVTWEMRAMEGNPKYEASQDVPEFPFAKYAESIGLRGIRVDSPDSVGKAWDVALASDRPVIFEARTDPEVPPLPPHITLEQAKAYASAVLKGDPDTRAMVRQTFRDFISGVLK